MFFNDARIIDELKAKNRALEVRLNEYILVEDILMASHWVTQEAVDKAHDSVKLAMERGYMK